jgi:hypothetical protein
MLVVGIEVTAVMAEPVTDAIHPVEAPRVSLTVTVPSRVPEVVCPAPAVPSEMLAGAEMLRVPATVRLVLVAA